MSLQINIVAEEKVPAPQVEAADPRKDSISTEEVKNMPRRGFKIVDSNLRSRESFQYVIGQTATARKPLNKSSVEPLLNKSSVEPSLNTNSVEPLLNKSSVEPVLKMCVYGLHFCHTALECLNYSAVISAPYRYLQVSPTSEVITIGDKSVTLNLFVEKELTAKEFLGECRQNLADGVMVLPHVLIETAIMECDIETLDFALKMNPAAREAPVTPRRIPSIQFIIERDFKNFNSPLVWAVANGRLNVVEFLLSLETSGYYVDNWQKNEGLRLAARMGSISMATTLIRAGPLQLDRALFAAAEMNKVPMMKFLLSEGATDIHGALCTCHIADETFQFLTSLPGFDPVIAEETARRVGYYTMADYIAGR